MKKTNIYQRLMAFLLVVTLLFGGSSLTMAATSAKSAKVKTEGDYKYQITEDGTAVLVKYIGKKTDVTIPSKLGKKKVVKIADSAFKGAKKLESVTVPETVKEIGVSAFQSCRKLIKVELPDGLTEICNDTFNGCSSLEEINIPQNLNYIGNYAFAYCNKLEKMQLPAGVTTMGEGAFESCKNLEEINLPVGLKNIPLAAFYGCSKLTGIVLPEGLEMIEEYAFSECKGLTQVVIPESVTSIEQNAFSYCKSLTKVTLPSRLTQIAGSMFIGCENLTEVNIPQGVTSIGTSAFSCCEKLENIEIPSTVTDFGGYAFVKTKWLENKKKENPAVVVNDTLIDASAFSGDAVLPNSFSRIGACAFSKFLVFPISNQTLNSVTIPEGVTEIGEQAFVGTDLEYIVIPNSIKIIKAHAFSGCYNLKNVSLPSTVVLEQNVFSETPWLSVQKQDDKLCIINNVLVRAPKKVEEITIPEQVTLIDSSAFSGIHVKSLTIPANVKEIAGGACGYNSKIENLIISEGVKSIGDYAFSNTSIESVTIPSSVEEIGMSAFGYCDKLKKVVFAAKTTEIERGLFMGCRNLTDVEIKEGVTTIPEYAFSYCNSLKNIVLPESVTNIGQGAFTKCKARVCIKNKNCNIYVGTKTIAGSISGLKGSTAQAYAERYGRDFSTSMPPENTEIKKVSATKKDVTMKWKKSNKKVKGYEIQYANNEDFKKAKTVKVDNRKKTSAKLTGLKAKTTYYVRIRTYSKEKLYSNWSNTMTVTTK